MDHPQRSSKQRFARLGVWVLLALMSAFAAIAQTTPQAAPRTASYYLAPVEGSGISGNLQVTEKLEGGSRLVVTLQGITPGARYALALFEGDCGPDRPLVTELEPVSNVDGDPYVSLNDSDLSFDTITEGNHFLYVYGGEETGAPVVACGEVGVGANANASGTQSEPTTPTQSETTTPAQPTSPTAPAPSTPGASLRAASYALSAVEGSGVSGNLQISERVEGGTRLTVTLRSNDPAARYDVALYQGDCGPDRPEVLRLTPVDASDGDPYSSITDSEIGFDALTQQDLFAYVLGPTGAVVACGEVGLGANP